MICCKYISIYFSLEYLLLD